MLDWILFAAIGVVSYIGISYLGTLTRGLTAHSPWQAAGNLLTPKALLVILAANFLWAAALYYGLRETRLALPILFVLGDAVGFVWAVAFFGAEVTMVRIAGLVLVLAGVYLLK
jgi:multidrug transporter EmrE-like cation transporter